MTKKTKATNRPAKEAAASQPEHVEGLTRLAAVIAGEFKIGCAKQNIVHWKTWNPPFPAPTQANRYHLPSCLAWVREHVLPDGGGEMSEDKKVLFERALRAEAQLTIDQQEKKAIELGVLKKTYIERSLAELSLAGVVKTLKQFFVREVERGQTLERRQKLEALASSHQLDAKAADRIVRDFCEFDRLLSQALVTRIEENCGKAAGTKFVDQQDGE